MDEKCSPLSHLPKPFHVQPHLRTIALEVFVIRCMFRKQDIFLKHQSKEDTKFLQDNNDRNANETMPT